MPQRTSLRTDLAAREAEVAMAAKRTHSKRKREAAEQDEAKRTDDSAKGRHGKGLRAGERSNGARRATPQGSNETRGGRERSERRGGSAVGKPRGRATHGRDGRARAQ